MRLMLDLAVHKTEGNISVHTISLRQEISEKYLEQIITILVKAKYVTSVRGTNGGYSLAKSTSEYSVGDILRVTEGSIAPVACVEDGNCDKAENCIAWSVWNEVYEAVNNVVDNITLEDLVNRQKDGIQNVFCEGHK